MLSENNLRRLKYAETICIVGVLASVVLVVLAKKVTISDTLLSAGVGGIFIFGSAFFTLYYGIRAWHFGFTSAWQGVMEAAISKWPKQLAFNNRFSKVFAVINIISGSAIFALAVLASLHALFHKAGP